MHPFEENIQAALDEGITIEEMYSWSELPHVALQLVEPNEANVSETV